jgi:hypothetical protein
LTPDGHGVVVVEQATQARQAAGMLGVMLPTIFRRTTERMYTSPLHLLKHGSSTVGLNVGMFDGCGVGRGATDGLGDPLGLSQSNGRTGGLVEQNADADAVPTKHARQSAAILVVMPDPPTSRIVYALWLQRKLATHGAAAVAAVGDLVVQPTSSEPSVQLAGPPPHTTSPA